MVDQQAVTLREGLLSLTLPATSTGPSVALRAIQVGVQRAGGRADVQPLVAVDRHARTLWQRPPGHL